MFRQLERASMRFPSLGPSTLQTHFISRLSPLRNGIFNPFCISTTPIRNHFNAKYTVFPRQPSSREIRTLCNGKSPNRNSIPDPQPTTPPTYKSHQNPHGKPILEPVSPSYSYNPKLHQFSFGHFEYFILVSLVTIGLIDIIEHRHQILNKFDRTSENLHES